MRVYYDRDADVGLIKKKKVVIVRQTLHVPLKIVRIVPDDFVDEIGPSKNLVQDTAEHVTHVFINVQHKASFGVQECLCRKEPLVAKLQIAVFIPGILVLNEFHVSLRRCRLTVESNRLFVAAAGTERGIQVDEVESLAETPHDQVSRRSKIVSLIKKIGILRYVSDPLGKGRHGVGEWARVMLVPPLEATSLCGIGKLHAHEGLNLLR